MAVQINGRELVLTGAVGELLFEDGFTHAQVIAALAKMSGDITVRLNSGGGLASEGVGIYSALATRQGKVHVVVEGIAASAASLIAMAGATITMSAGAVMMIHDPHNVTFGDSAAHQKTVEQLEAISTGYANIYAMRAGKTPTQARDIMRTETWYDGPQAVAAGFATASGGSRSSAVAAYDYRAYSRAPASLKAEAAARGWTRGTPSRDSSVQARADDAHAEAKAGWERVLARKRGEPEPLAQGAIAESWRRAAARIGVPVRGG